MSTNKILIIEGIIIISAIIILNVFSYISISARAENNEQWVVESYSDTTTRVESKPVIAEEKKTVASWYGDYYHGRKTANGEIFDENTNVCASPDLPFNTIIKVTNLANNKFVNVRINDRGPFNVNKKGILIKPIVPHPIRKLDLSKHAFKTISDLNTGLATVKYEIVCKAKTKAERRRNKRLRMMKRKQLNINENANDFFKPI